MINKIKKLCQFILSYFIDNYNFDYWHCALPCSNLIKKGDYFIDFSLKSNYPGPFDDNKIPLLDVSTLLTFTVKKVGLIYFPITILQYGLGLYSVYLVNNDDEIKNKFLNIAKWVTSSLISSEINGDIVSTLHHSPELFVSNNNTTKFIYSGMAQGEAISLLTRAYLLTNNDEYLQKSIECFNSFKYSLSEGGVCNVFKGIKIIEEFNIDPRTILNGHIFGFVGIMDLLNTKGLTNKTFNDVKNNYMVFLRSTLELVKLIDMGFWTRYSLRSGCLFPDIGSKFYQELHIEQLKGLYILTKEPLFKQYQNRWEKQKANLFYKILALSLKLLEKTEYLIKTRIILPCNK